MVLLIRNSCQDSLADMLYEIMRTVDYVLFVCLQSLFGVGVLIRVLCAMKTPPAEWMGIS